MKLALFSDLHTEGGCAWRPSDAVRDADLIILAGDIGQHTHGLHWAAKTFPEQPVVYVAGNHEYYRAHLGLLDELRAVETPNVLFLERGVLKLEGVRILGCTLWSAFDLYGEPDVAMRVAQPIINDFRVVQARGGELFQPKDARAMHRSSVAWLEAELARPFDGKTVVVTHFAPHRKCIAPQFVGDTLTPYFVTDLSALMARYPIDAWLFGHTHTNVDFIAEGGCRVVSNQHGYAREALFSGFRGDFLLEL